MRILPLLLGLLAWATTAFATPGVLESRTLTITRADGATETRTYWLYEPSTRQPGEVMPLLLAMHGGGMLAERFVGRAMGGTTLIAEAEVRGYVLIAPQGLGDEPAWRHTDDTTAMTAKANRVAGDDLAFLAALYTQVVPGLAIDPERIYGVGVSAGGMMLYRAACQRPGGLTFRALGLVSTTMTIAPEKCPYAWGVSVLHIHGSADTSVPYYGGGGTLWSPVNYPPVERGLNHFWAVNLCAAEVEVPRPAPDTQEWDMACANGTEVVLDVVDGGTHGWFVAPSVDATGRIFSFLARHS